MKTTMRNVWPVIVLLCLPVTLETLPLSNVPDGTIPANSVDKTYRSNPTQGYVYFEVTLKNYKQLPGEQPSLTSRAVAVTAPEGYAVSPMQRNPGWEYRYTGITCDSLEIKMRGRAHGVTDAEWANFRLLHYKGDGSIEDITSRRDEKSIFGTAAGGGIFAVVAPLQVFDKMGPVVNLSSGDSHSSKDITYGREGKSVFGTAADGEIFAVVAPLAVFDKGGPGVKVSSGDYHKNEALYINPSQPIALDAVDLSSRPLILAGVASTYYLLDADPAEECLKTAPAHGTRKATCSPNLYSHPIKLPEGRYSLRFWAIDKAGNKGPEGVAKLRVDGSPPVSVLRLNAAAIKPGTTVYARTTDMISFAARDLPANDMASGINSSSFLINISEEECDSHEWIGGLDGIGSCENRSYSKPFTFPYGDNVIYFYSKDNVGNKENLKTVWFTTGGTSAARVRNYKDFLAYAASEQAALKNPPLNTDTGQVKEVLRKMGLEFRPGAHWARDKEYNRIATISPDKKGIWVIDRGSQSINIYNPAGKITHKIPFPKTTDRDSGGWAYSNSRLFDFKLNGFDYTGSGFDIYNHSGQLIKHIIADWAERSYMISNDQKHVAIVAESIYRNQGYLLLYDMEGNKIWSRKIVLCDDAQIQFSLDDKFIIVKIPQFTIDPHGKIESRKLYLVRTRDGKLISEEQYAD